MAHGGGDDIDKGRIDLVPMIDCIMLLLIFFVMTTKFTAEEKAISSLLPTDKGQGAASAAKIDPPKSINICIYPVGQRMVKGGQPSEYAAELKRITNNGVITVFPQAYLRVGQRDPILIEGSKLSKGGTDVAAYVDGIHKYIGEELAKFEDASQPRNKQQDIVINCYSGLSWKFALISYDAVRSYEGALSGIKYTGDPKELDAARSVSFAPPRIRNYDANELGNELYEIIHMK